MGTVVFPEAKFKVFLTASSEERAKRRVNQLKNQGVNVSLAAVLRDIEARDERDTNRAVSPLKPADDALLLDSTDLSIEEVLNRIMSHCGFSKH
jgi:cytidylate kinase